MEFIQTFEQILQGIPSKLKQFSEEHASEKPRPEKWSKKEILGHLIDSAANNHQRFVRMQIDNKLHLPQYQQNEWVNIQAYHEKSWDDIIVLWQNYNTHLLHVMKHVDHSKLNNTAIFPDYGELTLHFLMDDYVRHMEHHLKQIFNY